MQLSSHSVLHVSRLCSISPDQAGPLLDALVRSYLPSDAKASAIPLARFGTAGLTEPYPVEAHFSGPDGMIRSLDWTLRLGRLGTMGALLDVYEWSDEQVDLDLKMTPRLRLGTLRGERRQFAAGGLLVDLVASKLELMQTLGTRVLGPPSVPSESWPKVNLEPHCA